VCNLLNTCFLGSTRVYNPNGISIGFGSAIFGRPFVKRFALCYRAVVLSVCNPGVLWPNGSMDQDKTWHKSRPRTRPHYVTWRPSFPSPKGAQPPIFGPYLLWPNGWMEQDATWYGGRLRPRPHCVRWEPDAPKKGHSSPTSWLMFIVAKRLDGSRCHLVRR